MSWFRTCRRRLIGALAAGVLIVHGIHSDPVNAGMHDSGDDDAEKRPEVRAAAFQVLPSGRDRPLPGFVQLHNGLIVSGMCSRATSLAPLLNGVPVERTEQPFELRLVDQKARQIYLHVMRSSPHTLDNTVWPTVTFRIPQKRPERKALPAGIPDLGPFDAHGIARGKLHRADGKSQELETGITAVNELYAEVDCLTHSWNYAVSTDSIPREHLLSILSQVDGFHEKPFVQLDLVGMLIRCNRLPEAAVLFNSVQQHFPELAARQSDYQQQIREQLAKQITINLEERSRAGQHRLASNGAGVYPQRNLTPETIVRVNQLRSFYTDTAQRIDRVRALLPELAGRIENAERRADALDVCRVIDAGLDVDSIDRMAAFELIASAGLDADESDETPESMVAIALSGWMMGTDQTSRNLRESLSLFDARQLIIDLLETREDDEAVRMELLDRIQRQEGVSADRIAAIIRSLPAVQPPIFEIDPAGGSGRFRLSGQDGGLSAFGIVPPEYQETRSYPVIVAMHGRFDTAEQYLNLWSSQAEKHGCIVVAPEWESSDSGDAASGLSEPDPSAVFHDRFLRFMRRLKLSLRADDDRIFIVGHDAGADLAMDLASSHADMFAGLVSIGGTGFRHLSWTASNTIMTPWYIVVGDAQQGWYERMGKLLYRLFHRDEENRTYFDVIFVKYPYRGLERYMEEMSLISEWMARHKRDPFPDKVFSRILRSTDVRWSWAHVRTLPRQFAQMDVPDPTSLYATGGTAFRPAELNIMRDDKDRNFFWIRSCPSDVSLLINPRMAGFDPSRPIRVRTPKRTTTIDYRPEIRHMLDEFYRTGDRSRLCYMRIDVTR